MRIARYVAYGGEPRYGIVELPEDAGDHPDTVATISGDPLAGPVNYTGERYALDDVRLVSPVIPRSKVVAIGKNYAAHAAEFNSTVPAEPLVFLKPNTSVIGPGEPIVYPPETSDLHFEGELAIVIGRICRRVPAERAAEVIFGYTVANDVTCRDLQAKDRQWSRAKGYDSFCPLGPWITTHLSPDDAGDLHLTTTLNGEPRQDSETSLMVYPIPRLIEFITSFTTLLPGDVILTGTPNGVGPMLPGDSVSVSIDGLGTLTNPVVAED
ncbi:MAG: fumarylacetoacetate hydrolase family protein [Micropruina sp.]|uniref:fumarylacetoacetate hydrolase family protein n=1 Tax=Micropruina sp. TaxID=2737536 RepID=UPI0039E407DA